MAFTGVPVVKKISDNLFRITGVSLVADATGTIGFSDKTVPAEISLVAPNWTPYDSVGGPAAVVGEVSIQDFVQCWFVTTTDIGDIAVPISIVKTGTTHADFLIAMHNDVTAQGLGSALLEIWVERGGH
jgi:hypothetical protein